MNAEVGSCMSRRKWIFVALGAALLVAWWVFRPEKLWINERVNEPATFASSSDAQPLYTGRLEGQAHQTRGRATIYKTPEGRQYLRLTDFTTSNGPDVHVLLARSDDQNLKQEIVKSQLDSVELGSLKGNQGDQDYDLPASLDVRRYDAVVIYCERFHAVFGEAQLERF